VRRARSERSNESARQITALPDWIIDEIEAQRQLLAAERGELDAVSEIISTGALLDALLATCSSPSTGERAVLGSGGGKS
jgi:hypothetical protein